MMMELLELPIEMLQQVASFLNAKSLASLGLTCRECYNVSNVDTLWQALCRENYNVFNKKGWNLTFKQIYTKILRPYPILGFHRLALQPFGGLVHISWEEGEIRVCQIRPDGRSSEADLVSTLIFSLTWDDDTNCIKVGCVQDSEAGFAPAVVSKSGSYFVLQCFNQISHPRHHGERTKFVGQSDKRIPAGFLDHQGAFDSFDLSVGCNCPLLPMELGPSSHPFPFTPGLYKADYGSHGVEILLVRAEGSNPHLMECLKVTGDPNVPAGNVSIMAYLDKPVILTEEQQLFIDGIIEADENRPDEAYSELFRDNNQPDLRQPFVIPNDIYEQNGPARNNCVGRYLGHGRIAGHNFRNPALCRIHVVKFDGDTFGVLWLDLYCFMVMHRVKQSF